MDNEQIPFLERATLSCEDVEELLDCYIDQEMVSALKLRFEKHLDDCESCKDLVSDCQHIVDVAKTLDEEPIPKVVSMRLRRALKERVGFSCESNKPHLTLVKSDR